jgi:hypothetical protein
MLETFPPCSKGSAYLQRGGIGDVQCDEASAALDQLGPTRYVKRRAFPSRLP